MADKKVFSTVTKNLLKNVIRHTDSHNKVVEETDMWRQREKQVAGRGRDSRGSDYSFLKDSRSDMRFEFESRRERSAHMDEEPQSSEGTYWMKQLYKAEEADKNRWGHSGFKELYPEHFTSTDYSSSSDDDSHRKHKKSRHKSNHSHRKSKKRKHEDSDSDSEVEKPKKHKKKHKHKDKKKHKKSKHKKKKHRKESSSESS